MKTKLEKAIQSQDFYELMQSYRICDTVRQDEVVKRFEAVKNFILEAGKES